MRIRTTVPLLALFAATAAEAQVSTLPPITQNPPIFTLTPKGRHVMSMFTQYFPYKLAADAGTLEENKRRYAERCIDIMTEYAPNFRKSVIDYQVLAPADLEAFGKTL